MALSELRIVDSQVEERGVLVIDAEKQILFADANAASLLGMQPSDLIGKACSEFSSILPCANSVCRLDSPCHFLSTAPSDAMQVRSNEQCAFQSQIVVNGNGQRLGTLHIVTMPHPRQIPLDNPTEFEGIIGAHPSMKRLYEMISLVAPTDVTVHIFGESGVGKELVAEAIHKLSVRSGKRLVKLNCSTIPTTLLESTLFGHIKGSFTGALKDAEGYVEYAEGGTLFLDEIGDVSHEVQVKLLRLLESREFSRVGETRTRVADIRIVTATNQDLKKLVVQGKIREDFFYRINVFPLIVPSLKDRNDDLELLGRYFVERFNKRLKRKITGISRAAMQLLEQYEWPGNVREFQHAVEHAFIRAANGELLPEHFPSFHNETTTHATVVSKNSMDESSIRRVLEQSNGNASEAARKLGVSRVTLWKYMKRLGIHRL